MCSVSRSNLKLSRAKHPAFCMWLRMRMYMFLRLWVYTFLVRLTHRLPSIWMMSVLAKRHRSVIKSSIPHLRFCTLHASATPHSACPIVYHYERHTRCAQLHLISQLLVTFVSVVVFLPSPPYCHRGEGAYTRLEKTTDVTRGCA